MTQALNMEPIIPVESKKPSNLKYKVFLQAAVDAFIKLNPRWMVRNPVMFVTEVGSVLTTALWIQALLGHGEVPTVFVGGVTLWLWLCVFFANFSEALAEGRGKAQAAALRRTRRETHAKKLSKVDRDSKITMVLSNELKQNDLFLVETGDMIPADGEVVQGIASVDESAVTGRVRHHRRVRARHSRGGWRPQCRDRRDQRAVGPAADPHHGKSRRRIPGPHDFPD